MTRYGRCLVASSGIYLLLYWNSPSNFKETYSLTIFHWDTRGVFRNLQNIDDGGAFVQKYLTPFSRWLFSRKGSAIVTREGRRYASWLFPKFVQNLRKNSWNFDVTFISLIITINIIHLLIASKNLTEMLKSQIIQPILIKGFFYKA